MCAPVIGAAGTILGAYGALSAGNQARAAADANAAAVQREAASAAAAADFNAAALTQRAGERVQIAAADAARVRTRNDIAQGQNRANAAASGLQMEGSPLEALAFAAGQQAQDVEAVILQGNMDARDMLTEAALQRWQGRNAITSGQSQAAIMRTAGRQAQTAGQIRAGATLLTGARTWGQRLGGGGG